MDIVLTAIVCMLAPADPERPAGHGPLAQLPEQIGAGLAGMFSGDGAPKPQAVADAIVKLIDTPAGSRPLRTVVDAHPEGAQAINQVCEQIQAGALAAMGLGGLLKPATRSQAS
ncbi:MAG: hypothetical protein H0T76_00220 [Nannocystis sp.]|nr:hypothetical protein [Nannocystis sp.]MBA3544884.1 hypothetical protein [Nannocystis sp.]